MIVRPARLARSALVGALALGGVLVGGVVACGPAAPTPPASVAVVATPSPTPSPTPTPSPSPTPTPTPTLTPSLEPADLTGVLVAPDRAHRLPIAVMIDDNRAARPQSGFNAASLVYQATADGYETRYLLVFGEADAPDVGPVRSARFFLVQWAQEARAAIAHYGGDRRTRTYLRYHQGQFTDVDGLGRGNKAYHRIKSRKAPHNAYASTASLRKMADKLGAPETMPERFHRRPFRDPLPLAERPASQSIRIPYRTNTITYAYDPATDTYLRSINGKPHVDPADGQRVTAANVVVLFQKFRIDTKIEPGHSRPDITTLGSGKAWIFVEGRLIKGRWSKSSDTAVTRFLDADGNEVPLVRGRTFIQVVPLGTKVTAKGGG